MTPKLTRSQLARAVETQLRAVGPQSVSEIKVDLGLTKRQVEDAIWLLSNQGRIEYATTFPTTYKVTSTEGGGT